MANIFKDIQSIIAMIGFVAYVILVFAETFLLGNMSLNDAFVNIVMIIIGFYFGKRSNQKTIEEVTQAIKALKE